MDDPRNIATTDNTLIAALSTLPPPCISSLSHSLSSTFRHHDHRLSAVLSSPALFSLTLRHLYSLSLSQKSLLIARHLLSTLQLLTPFFGRDQGSDHHDRRSCHRHSSALSAASRPLPLRDIDAVLLLLLFCELRQHDPKVLETVSPDEWQRILLGYHCDNVLSLSVGVKVSSNYEVLACLIDLVGKGTRFVRTAVGCGNSGGNAGREVAASAAAVVALPSVEVRKGLEECCCAICKEEMREGRDVCELPCQHIFHWVCVLRWLRKSNTCPCCRLRLPSDDVLGEIERLWEVVVKASQQ